MCMLGLRLVCILSKGGIGGLLTSIMLVLKILAVPLSHFSEANDCFLEKIY